MKNAAVLPAALEIKREGLFSAYRRDSRILPFDKTTDPNEKRGFSCAEIVYHSNDYTKNFINIMGILVGANPAD